MLPVNRARWYRSRHLSGRKGHFQNGESWPNREYYRPQKRHRRRPSAKHCDRDPQYLPPRRQTVCREDRSQKSKRQREQRVLKLDHRERGI